MNPRPIDEVAIKKMAAVSEAQDKFMNGAPRFVPQHDT